MLKQYLDLGIHRLLPEWRAMFSTRYLSADLIAGLIVTCVAIPLSLAIALASGVSAEVGLVTAIVAGVVCALFGGVTLAVSGPAAAMAVLISAVLQDYGMTALIFVGFGCGILQLLTGMFGFGTLIRFVPVPVVMGFTAGIGAIILIGQFPRILGLPAPEESHIYSVILHIKNLLDHTQPAAFLLAMSTMGLMYVMPRVWPRLPAPIFAVIIPSAAAYFLHVSVDTVGAIPNTLPFPKLPVFPDQSIEWIELLTTTLVVYALASLETLLSAGSVDQLAKSKPHDSNQELIGQGLGNMAVTLFGGIPVTAVIARSALNVHAGAKTRRSAIFHSLFLLATVYLFAPIMGQIPIAVLSGILITIALRMCHPREFLILWRTSRMDAYVYLVTFLMIVALGLMGGIQAGLIAALLFSAVRLSQVDIKLYESQFGPAQLSLNGPLTFLSVSKLKAFEEKLNDLSLPKGVIIDLMRVKSLDSSGASQLIGLIEQMQAKHIKFVLHGVQPDYVKILATLKPDIGHYVAESEKQMETILGLSEHHHELTFDRVIYGMEKFRQNLGLRERMRFSNLAANQTPHTLFVTCSDSRIDPNLITSTQPGELFIVRNVGNIIPTFGKDTTPAEGAAIEFALGVLNVKRIIVCGHSHCGAMKLVLSGDIFEEKSKEQFPCAMQWLSLLKSIPRTLTPENAAKLNASMQLDNIRSYPLVRERISQNTLKLQAIYYDIGKSELQLWDEVLGKYIVIGEGVMNHI